MWEVRVSSYGDHEANGGFETTFGNRGVYVLSCGHRNLEMDRSPTQVVALVSLPLKMSVLFAT
jgi:hypothetical protein